MINFSKNIADDQKRKQELKNNCTLQNKYDTRIYTKYNNIQLKGSGKSMTKENISLLQQSHLLNDGTKRKNNPSC